METCGGRQATPGALFVHCGHPDRTHMRRDCLHFPPTKEEASPAPCPSWEEVEVMSQILVYSDESNPRIQQNTPGIETPEMESHSNIQQEEQPARISLQIRRPQQHLNETMGKFI